MGIDQPGQEIRTMRRFIQDASQALIIFAIIWTLISI